MAEDTSRPLTAEQIASLQENGCSADDWSSVKVTAGFDAARLANVELSGSVRIGSLAGTVSSRDGLERPAGIRNACLRNVSVGDGCSIRNVGGRLADLNIERGVVIENVGSILCSGESTFGNGHEIEVLNEGGGRELKITTRTSAQTAYLSVLYRDRSELMAAMTKIADTVADSARGNRAMIGQGALVRDCVEIVDVCIGPHAEVSGAQRLRNGTIDSAMDAPTIVGSGVIAEDFIFQKGSHVADGAMIAGSLVGEGTRIGKQFSAENSVFFANSEGFHSEACSLFAGPYSVTHHRSTLMIAALCSFFNAGSGTNQSNHMYKLGPVHQGIIERGCKTGSFSYLLWPCRVGAFTAVMGKHYANFDTSDFPFSYIAEEGGRSTLVPGMNFFTVGTMRDGQKWPARDRRTTADKLDLIVFDVLSPYTAQKMMRGVQRLTELSEGSAKGQEYVTCSGIHIKRLLLKTCKRYYNLALDKYFGDVLVRRIEGVEAKDLRAALAPSDARLDAGGEWLDLCGLICRKTRVEALIADITGGVIDGADSLQAALQTMFNAYRADEWDWFAAVYRARNGHDIAEATPEALTRILDPWQSSSLKLLNMVTNDAQKEFEGDVRIGFGIDGNGDADFDAVRGAFDAGKFVRQLKQDAVEVQATCGRIKALLEGLA